MQGQKVYLPLPPLTSTCLSCGVMVTQQILVLSFWVRVPAAQHTKAPFSGAFVVFSRDWHCLWLLLKWKSCTLEPAQMNTSILTPSAMVCQSDKKVVLSGIGRVTSVVIFRTARRRDYGTPSVMTRSCFQLRVIRVPCLCYLA